MKRIAFDALAGPVTSADSVNHGGRVQIGLLVPTSLHAIDGLVLPLGFISACDDRGDVAAGC